MTNDLSEFVSFHGNSSRKDGQEYTTGVGC